MSTNPLVSVLTCTRGRRDRFRQALACYRSQTWANKELVVIEDGDESVYDLIHGMEDVHYLFKPGNLATKRNAGVRFALGQFVVHQDDDDWSGAGRILDQVATLLAYPELDVTGYGQTYWWDEVELQASLYKGPLWGATLCYRRNFAVEHPFPNQDLGEDGGFIAASKFGQDVAGNNFVAVMHDKNHRRGPGVTEMWPLVAYEKLPLGFRETIEADCRYNSATSGA